MIIYFNLLYKTSISFNSNFCYSPLFGLLYFLPCFKWTIYNFLVWCIYIKKQYHSGGERGVWTHERKRTTAAANKWSAGGDACHFRYVTKGFGTFCAMQFTPSHLSAQFTVAAAPPLLYVMCMRGGVLATESKPRVPTQNTPL
jgi:hypothetical protein